MGLKPTLDDGSIESEPSLEPTSEPDVPDEDMDMDSDGFPHHWIVLILTLLPFPVLLKKTRIRRA